MSAVFCDKQAIQTGNFSDFSRAVISTELFENVRWAGLAPVSGVAQFERMP
ncbi:hypothetical protein AX16_003088 [Volvariella volvacea WC 439]|nr:hypothetical protein AX16_003088 [Volvariella volvacea WC 439]